MQGLHFQPEYYRGDESFSGCHIGSRSVCPPLVGDADFDHLVKVLSDLYPMKLLVFFP